MKRTKTYLSDSALSDKIIEYLTSTEFGKSEILGRIRKTYRCGTDRYIKVYDQTYKEWHDKKNHAQTEVISEKAKEAIEAGLWAKVERQLKLQKMLEDDYKHPAVVIIGGVPKTITRSLTPGEIQSIHAELSKMDGSYSPLKLEDTTVKKTQTIILSNGTQIELS